MIIQCPLSVYHKHTFIDHGVTVPGVPLKHSASSGHSNLECLLFPAVLEVGQDGDQGSSTELGSP